MELGFIGFTLFYSGLCDFVARYANNETHRPEVAFDNSSQYELESSEDYWRKGIMPKFMTILSKS